MMNTCVCKQDDVFKFQIKNVYIVINSLNNVFLSQMSLVEETSPYSARWRSLLGTAPSRAIVNCVVNHAVNGAALSLPSWLKLPRSRRRYDLAQPHSYSKPSQPPSIKPLTSLFNHRTNLGAQPSRPPPAKLSNRTPKAKLQNVWCRPLNPTLEICLPWQSTSNTMTTLLALPHSTQIGF